MFRVRTNRNISNETCSCHPDVLAIVFKNVATPLHCHSRGFLVASARPSPHPSVSTAMAPKWKMVAVSAQVAITGGWSTKSHTMDSKDIVDGNGTSTFVKVTKNEDWLLNVATGGQNKGVLKDVLIFDELKRALCRTAGHDDSAVAEPAPVDGSAVAVDDPMAEIDDLKPHVPVKRPRKYTRARKKDIVVKIEMPARERTANPTCEDKYTVSLLGVSTNSMWIGKKDLPWLMLWIKDEFGTGGVPMIADNAEDALQPNCDAPGIHMRWDSDDAYEAIGVDGLFKGKQTKCVVSKMTPVKWQVVDAIYGYGVTFEAATRQQLKDATRQYLEHTLKTRLDAAAQPLASSS